MRDKTWLLAALMVLASGCAAEDADPVDFSEEESPASWANDHLIVEADGSVALAPPSNEQFGQVRLAQTTSWPANIGSCADRTSPPRDKSGYHRSEHIGSCVLPDKLPVFVQTIDSGAGVTGGAMCVAAINEALNRVFDATGQGVYFVASNGTSPHPPDIVFDCNDQTSPLAVTISGVGAVSIDPWNGVRRLASRPLDRSAASTILFNSPGVHAHYNLYWNRVGGVQRCINMTRQEFFSATMLHELLHALGFSHDNYNAGVNLLTIMDPTGAIPSKYVDSTCNAGTDPGFRVAWTGHVDQRTVDPVFATMLNGFYANNSLLPEL